MNDASPHKTNDEFERRLAELETTNVNLIKTVAENNEAVDKLADKVNGSMQAQNESDGRLNAVIFMVEKFLGNQNGKK